MDVSLRDQQYMIADPAQQQIMVYQFGEKVMVEQYSFDEDVPVGIYKGFSIRVN